MSRHLDTAVLVLALVGFWQAVHLVTGDLALVSPLATIERAAELLVSPAFWRHAGASAEAVILALSLALVAGLALGIWLGSHRLSGDVAEPYLVALYTIPKITLYPVILLIFGLGLSAKVAFGAIHGVFPITIFVVGAVRNLDPVLIKSARVMGLRPLQIARHVMLPAALPEVLSGLRVGLSATLLGTLIGEMFAAKDGLGQLLMRGMTVSDGATIMALTLILFLIALVLNAGLMMLERRGRGAGRADTLQSGSGAQAIRRPIRRNA